MDFYEVCFDVSKNNGQNVCKLTKRHEAIKNVPFKLLVIMNTTERYFLKKCASSNVLSAQIQNLNLREAKSYAGAMADAKLPDSDLPCQTNDETCLELFCKDPDNQQSDKKSIVTRDAVTEETYYINDEFLLHKNKTLSGTDIAWTWKKDCRMWLWKNGTEFKKNRSVAAMSNLRISN